MYYIIYKTTNKINDKYYIGCHRTANLNDRYLGSGKHLRHAIKKYGEENFQFEILHSVSSKEKMFEIERSLVNEDLVKDKQTYNLKIGGIGGKQGIVGAFKGKTHTEETKEKIRRAALMQITSDEKRRKLSVNSVMKNKDIAKKVSISLTGRTCSENHRKNVAAANIGKILINNSAIAKRILKDDLAIYEKLGWVKGGLPRNKSR